MFLFTLSAFMLILLLYRPPPDSLKEPLPPYRQNAKAIKGTLLLGVVLILVFYVTSGFGFETSAAGFLHIFGLNTESRERWVWQLLTHNFLHANGLHLYANLGAIGLFSHYERRVGAKRYLLVFLFSGVVGGLMQGLLSPDRGVFAGASGGLFGIGAAYFLDRPNLSLKQRLKWLGFGIVLMILLSIDTEIDIGERFRIDHWGHIFGALAGLAYCHFFPLKPSPTQPAPKKPATLSWKIAKAVLAVVAILFLVIFGILAAIAGNLVFFQSRYVEAAWKETAKNNLHCSVDELSEKSRLEACTALAEQGDASAQYVLYLLLQDSDAEKARKWLRKAADQLPDAMYRLAQLYKKGDGVKNDGGKANELMISSAVMGHAIAQMRLCFYLNEIAYYSEAAPLCTLAADQGLLMAKGSVWLLEHRPKPLPHAVQYHFQALYHYTAPGMLKDFAKAAELFRKGAEMGFADSQEALGLMYLKGEGVTQNAEKAAEYLTKAADQGLATSQHSLATLYIYGNGVPKDMNKAVALFRKAAETGLVNSQEALTKIYYYGDGVKKDHKEAFHWASLAVKQDSAQAATFLGAMYGQGFGVEKDNEQAIKWLKRAAEQGDTTAAKVLRERYPGR